MEESNWLSSLAGGRVSIKAENLQRTGSFKIRGAYLRMSRLSPQEKANGVVAASAGNHAQGVALAAQLLGIAATVFMPEGAPIPKEKATRGYGARCVFHGTTIDEALVAARAFADETGAVLIHPFDHVDIVTGQGTCGLEILDQCPGVRTVLVLHRRGRLRRRHRYRDQEPPSRGAGRGRPGRRCRGLRRLARRGPPGGAEVDDDHGRRDRGRPAGGGAVRGRRPSTSTGSSPSARTRCPGLCCCCWSGPSWSSSLPGRRQWPPFWTIRRRFETPAVVVLSGGNVDPLLLMRVIRSGLAAAGRFLVFRVSIPDVPGDWPRCSTSSPG